MGTPFGVNQMQTALLGIHFGGPVQIIEATQFISKKKLRKKISSALYR